MVKSENKKELSFFDYLKSSFQLDLFKSKKINLNSIMLYNFILLVVVSLINVLKTLSNAQSAIQSFIYTLVGLPLLMLLLYSIFYIFLNAFEDKRKPFIESFLVFSAIILPFVIDLHILNWIGTQFVGAISIMIWILILLLYIYLLINLIFNFKNYYSTSGYRVLASIIIVQVLLLFMGTMQYFALAFSNTL